MNEYKYAEITIGQEEKFSVVLTQDKMDKFRDITGDINPLHNDEKFALQGGVHGARCLRPAGLLVLLNAGWCAPTR